MAHPFAALGLAALSPSTPAVRDALSGIFGSISLTAWICLLLPQLITNFKAKSADGLSMAFLFVWLFGDVTNLAGALLTSLAPTAIALACYFCIADLVLIAQCTYYNAINARRRRRHRHPNHHHHPHHHPQHNGAHKRRSSTARDPTPYGEAASSPSSADAAEEAPAGPTTEHTERSPLLIASRRHSTDSGERPRSHPRRPSHRHSDVGLDPLTRIITGDGEDSTHGRATWINNALSLGAVYVVGAAGWVVSWRMGAWDADPGLPEPDDATQPTAVLGLVLGYISAICYLCARIPQIIKNYREKSCEGLSLLFFLLSLTGNFTYGASLIAYSQERDYILRALPWLLGSLGTIVEDCIIFVQFRIYAGGKAGEDGQV
ncbi:hypothetical protein VTK73DRAFT_1071 [Phialemonium thermophilum]|uniref:Vacuolar membrane PQ loop repeat protein n=1 Tax=Phialemonium thermophilum TaxID=223376 RepID=A0ABR3VU29_9PEZI